MTTTTIDQAAAQLAGHQGFSIISDESLRQLYTSMVICRQLNERGQAHAHADKPGGDVGHEAAVAGVIAGLRPEDTLANTESGLILLKLQDELEGKPMNQMLVRTARLDSDGGYGVALRAAQANKSAKNSKIAVIFLEVDSGFSEEALRQAGAERLPILFVRQTSHLSEWPVGAVSILPFIPVDGRDVVAIYRVATESITHARKGNGPTLIDCVFDPTDAEDPILKMEAYLTRKGLFSEAWKREEWSSVARRLDLALPPANR
jgi:pyruvate dehydrogenase E1 component alpha subunit